jgi:hypothetical protein
MHTYIQEDRLRQKKIWIHLEKPEKVELPNNPEETDAQ